MQSNKQPQNSSKDKVALLVVLGKIGAVLFVIVGLVGGFYIGAIVSFSTCFKQSCNPIEGSAPFWLPVASLLITVPVARKIFRFSDEQK